MTYIPGDREYGDEVLSVELDELAERLEFVKDDLDRLRPNVDALLELVKLLRPEGSKVQESIARVMEPSGEMLETMSNFFEKLMELSGVQVEPVSDSSDTEVQIETVPPELRGESPEKIRQMLGERIYGLGDEELDQRLDIIARATTVVQVSEDGRLLKVIKGPGAPRSTSRLSPRVIRGINIYNRMLITGVQEFRKSDVDEVFGPEGGLNNLVDIIHATNDTLEMELVSPFIFATNGEQRQKARYMPTGKLIFLRHDAS